MAGSNAGKRWVEILRVLRDELPGEWSIRGSGLKSLLVREPIGWAIPWIGASKASSVRMHTGVAPALTPTLSWPMGVFGLDMSELPKDLRSLPLGEDGDLEVSRAFAGHALARIEELTPERYADRAERTLQLLDRADAPPMTYLSMAPGWRVVNGNGDPVEAAQACIASTQKQSSDPEAVARYVGFFEGLIAAWKAGGRDQALAFLAENRDRQLGEQGYDQPHP